MVTTGCKLIGTSFEIQVQFILAFVSGICLITKWQCEKYPNKRTCKIFSLDVSKQGFSGILAHFLNMLFAYMFSKLYNDTDPCSWYFISFSFDTLLGLYIAYKLLEQITNYYSNNIYLKESGNYNENEREDCGSVCKVWSVQTSVWCGIVIISRLIVAFILLILSYLLKYIADLISIIFMGHPKSLLIFVMIVCPGFMNLTQILIQDHILKRKTNNGLLDQEIVDNNSLIEDDELNNPKLNI